MEIYVLRHGIAENVKPGAKDADRALTAEGREKLKRVLKRARQAGVEPALILASPYRRAQETAEVAAEVLGYRGKVADTAALVPNSSPQEVWEEIRALKESSILLAGHEPLLSGCVAFLLGNPTLLVDMKKAALVRIDCDHFGAEPHGILKWMLTPATAGD